ncbi:CsiV family protein [Halioxenophilus aromaticivorans]|uniref:Peptidoglycan binding protein CsiV n=1 Tax=Halioxenophilus aromaticivorans TaxID=1306992 RepID=A0AAV3TY57_9ALTE
MTRSHHNHVRKARFVKSLVGLAIASMAQASLAQSDADSGEQTPWYQIELIVFSQTLNEVDAQESWPSDIVLAYPLGTTTLQPSPKEGAETSDELESQAPVESPTNQPKEYVGTQPEALDQASIDGGVPSSEPVTTEPFTELSSDQHSLNTLVETLERNSKYRVLKHVAWRQPAYDSEDTRPVVMVGGDAFEDHHELEGTVALKVSRYLHLQTNLWMTQFYPNYGQQSGYTKWPALPDVPGSEIGVEGTPEALEYSSEGWLTDTSSANTSTSQFGLDSNFSSSEIKGPAYIIDNIIFNHQSRKLRTDELHYIDHPAMGIIAKVTEWDPTASNTEEMPGPALNDGN